MDMGVSISMVPQPQSPKAGRDDVTAEAVVGNLFHPVLGDLLWPSMAEIQGEALGVPLEPGLPGVRAPGGSSPSAGAPCTGWALPGPMQGIPVGGAHSLETEGIPHLGGTAVKEEVLVPEAAGKGGDQAKTTEGLEPSGPAAPGEVRPATLGIPGLGQGAPQASQESGYFPVPISMGPEDAACQASGRVPGPGEALGGVVLKAQARDTRPVPGGPVRPSPVGASPLVVRGEIPEGTSPLQGSEVPGGPQGPAPVRETVPGALDAQEEPDEPGRAQVAPGRDNVLQEGEGNHAARRGVSDPAREPWPSRAHVQMPASMPRPELAEGPVQAGEIGTRPGKIEEVVLPEMDRSRGQASPERKPFQEVPEAMQQMVERFRLVRAGERHHVEMDLKPPHLGNLSVRITGTEDGVTARFEVGSVAAKSLVEYHIADLRQSLEASGVRLGSVVVDMGQGGQDPRGDHREKALGRRVFPVKTWEVPWDLEASPCSLNYLA